MKTSKHAHIILYFIFILNTQITNVHHTEAKLFIKEQHEPLLDAGVNCSGPGG